MKNLERWRDRCYSQVPDHLYQRLKAFRESHPYKMITSAGHDWKYICGGESSDAVLLLTGGASPAEGNWKDILRHEKRFRVIAPSYPPVGSVDNAIEGILSVLDAEGIDRVNIIGGSLGAGVGHAFIRRYPDRVHKLVLIAFGLPGGSFVADKRRTVRMCTVVPWWVIKRIVIKRGQENLSALPEDEAAFTQAYFRDVLENDMDKRTLVGHIKIALDLALSATALRLTEVVDGSGRVLIIQADDDDEFTREDRQALDRTYAGATTHLFKTGGHLLDFSHGAEIAEMIDQFLNEEG